MGANPPVVYLLHGEDEIAIARFVTNLKAKLGDPASAALSITSLDGHNLILDELVTAISALPFLTSRRLVILDHPLAAFPGEQGQRKLLDLLSRIPPTTAVVLVEHVSLISFKMKKSGKTHWLEKWALDSSDRVYLREFKLPGREGMAGWIQGRARESGGIFSGSAATKLASQVGDDVRILDQEIQKLLTFVRYDRPVTEEDVMKLTPYSREADIFEMVDAIGNRDRSRAERVYHRLLQDEDPAGIFQMVVRQFRLMILVKEILDRNESEEHLIKTFRLSPYEVKKISSQARRFKQSDLESNYHRLVEIDFGVKSGEIDVDLGMELFIVDIKSPGNHSFR